MARNTVRTTRNTRNRQKNNGNSGGFFRALLEVALLAGGGVAGWMLHAELGTTTPPAASKDVASEQAVECPAPAESDSQPARNVYSHAVTGEGVIEFKFYGNDNTTVTRKWVARIPIPAGAGLPVAPDSPASIEEIIQKSEDVALPKENKAVTPPPAVAPTPAPAQVKTVAKQTPVQKPQKPTPASKPKIGDKRFAIQISAHRDRASAEERVAQMEERGFDARVIRADIPGKGTWYRVRTGRNLTREKATRLGEKLGSILGHTTSVVEQE